MARNSRKSSNTKAGGSTLFGMLLGLIFGLAAAVAVALFVTQVPMPFVDKFSREPANTLLPDVRNAPDPNIGLYGKDSAAGLPSSGPTGSAPLPLPGLGPNTGTSPGGTSSQDNIGELIASLGSTSSPADTKATPRLPPGTEPPAAAPPASTPSAAQTTYYLQAGAFRSEKDAEAMKARIIMLGLPAQVQKAQVNGGTLNRVRVGPFKGIDEMNRSRTLLGEEKIVSSVVRP